VSPPIKPVAEPVARANHIAPIRSFLIDSDRRPSNFYAHHEKNFHHADNRIAAVVGTEFPYARTPLLH
jgi:hypothetical protein